MLLQTCQIAFPWDQPDFPQPPYQPLKPRKSGGLGHSGSMQNQPRSHQKPSCRLNHYSSTNLSTFNRSSLRTQIPLFSKHVEGKGYTSICKGYYIRNNYM